MKSNLSPDHMQKMFRGEMQPPVAELVGFRVVSVEPGQAVFEFQAQERHTNPMGTVQGGVLCCLADAAMGYAYASTLEQGETFTTLELKINYLKPIWNGRLCGPGGEAGTHHRPDGMRCD